MPKAGDVLYQKTLANTLEQLVRADLDDFYRGELGAAMEDELQALGSLLSAEDLRGCYAQQVNSLSVTVKGAKIFNLPPPTQGLASLMMLPLVLYKAFTGNLFLVLC